MCSPSIWMTRRSSLDRSDAIHSASRSADEDGQKLLLAIKSMGGKSTEAWRAVLDDLIQRGLRRLKFFIVDGAPGLDNALAAVWDGVPVQRCTVHKHQARNLLAHAHPSVFTTRSAPITPP
jgi:transposase-like protein